MNFLTQNSVLVFSLLAGIVLVLGVYLVVLGNRIKSQKKEREQQEQERLDYIEESIRVIALATVQDQCGLSEAVLRVKNLLDAKGASETHENESIFQMYEEIKHFPTHVARKEQDKNTTFKQDSERFQIEEKYKDRLLESFNLLLEKSRN
ncbi:MAG: DUF2489 domain-containing protein [Spirochaetota bacterium]